MTKGLFAKYPQEETDIRTICFGNDSKWLLYSCSENVIVLLDSFTGQSVRKFKSHVNEESLTLEANFSPDSKFIVSGSENGNIYIWDLEGELVKVLEGHVYPSRHVRFSPKFNVIASACNNLIFWIPGN